MSKEYDSYLKKVGNTLRRIRKEKGYSMENLANEAEIEYRQLGRIERGEINTSIISLLRICETLEIELKNLFEDWRFGVCCLLFVVCGLWFVVCGLLFPLRGFRICDLGLFSFWFVVWMWGFGGLVCLVLVSCRCWCNHQSSKAGEMVFLSRWTFGVPLRGFSFCDFGLVIWNVYCLWFDVLGLKTDVSELGKTRGAIGFAHCCWCSEGHHQHKKKNMRYF